MILYAVVLLGLVIFVHELGHFLAARLFGVKVFAFSLGFGKAIWKKQRGETEYRIGIVPLGGYVKMLGEGTEEEVLAGEDMSRSLSEKPAWQKIIIVGAGPVMNLVFAFLLYAGVSISLYTTDAAVIEHVSPGSAALAAGIVEGDRITAIDGKKVSVWDDIYRQLPDPQNNACPSTEILLTRFPAGAEQKLTLVPMKRTFADPLGIEIDKCIIGVAALPKDGRIAVAGVFSKLVAGDLVKSVGGKPVNRYYQIVPLIASGGRLLEIERGDKVETVTLTDEEASQLLPLLKHGGMVLKQIDAGSVSEREGFQKGDLITAVNGKPVGMPYEFVSELKTLKEGAEARIEFWRSGAPMEKTIKLSFESKQNHYTGMTDTNLKWGGQFFFNFDIEPEQSSRHDPLMFTLRHAVKESWNISVLTIKGIWYLITGKLSPKSLGGPIMVFDISQKAAKLGFKVYLEVMAMISINLGLINLFPIPVLDGGHITVYTVEGALKRRLSKRAKEILTIIGIALLSSVMLFAIFNDFSRYFAIFMGK